MRPLQIDRARLRSRTLGFYRPSNAFSLTEVLVCSAIFVVLTTIGFNAMGPFNEERKMRSAAIELASYLESARTMAHSTNSSCVITLEKSEGGVFAPVSTGSFSPCTDPNSIITALDLGDFTGSHRLRVQISMGQGSLPLTFSPEGTTRTGVTFLISSSNVKAGSWCVNVEPPLATVRRGWRANGSEQCVYTVDE